MSKLGIRAAAIRGLITFGAAVGVLFVSLLILIYVQGVRGARCRDWPKELTEYRSILTSPAEPLARMAALANGAKAAAEVGEFASAEAWATEALALAPTLGRNWNYGNVIHDAHLALGRVALARGDRTRAREELLLAGQTPGSPQLNSFGPNMALARDMLRSGEREATIEYFHECSRFWELGRPRLRRWENLVRWHLPPDFGANLDF